MKILILTVVIIVSLLGTVLINATRVVTEKRAATMNEVMKDLK